MDQSKSRIFTFHSDDVKLPSAIGTEFNGKKRFTSARRPFAIYSCVCKASVMPKYFVLTCLLFPFISFIILLVDNRGVFSEDFTLSVCCERGNWHFFFFAREKNENIFLRFFISKKKNVTKNER